MTSIKVWHAPQVGKSSESRDPQHPQLLDAKLRPIPGASREPAIVERSEGLDPEASTDVNCTSVDTVTQLGRGQQRRLVLGRFQKLD